MNSFHVLSNPSFLGSDSLLHYVLHYYSDGMYPGLARLARAFQYMILQLISDHVHSQAFQAL
jgi:hypothetical protein